MEFSTLKIIAILFLSFPHAPGGNPWKLIKKIFLPMNKFLQL